MSSMQAPHEQLFAGIGEEKVAENLTIRGRLVDIENTHGILVGILLLLSFGYLNADVH